MRDSTSTLDRGTSHPPSSLTPSIAHQWRYAVTATLLSDESTTAYVAWLLAGHIDAVCQWAESAEIVVLTDPQNNSSEAREFETALGSARHVQSVYWFSDYETFQRYERDGAPALRAEGVELAQALGGITFERMCGWSIKVQ